MSGSRPGVKTNAFPFCSTFVCKSDTCSSIALVACRSGTVSRSIVQWTHATESNRAALKQLIVQHVVEHADGPRQGTEAFKPVFLELCQQPDGSEAFTFNKVVTRTKPCACVSLWTCCYVLCVVSLILMLCWQSLAQNPRLWLCCQTLVGDYKATQHMQMLVHVSKAHGIVCCWRRMNLLSKSCRCQADTMATLLQKW